MKKVILLGLACFYITFAMAQNNLQRDVQFSLITPLGTNGTKSHLISNRYSFNVLGGYSYGNTVIELGGLYNVNTGFTRGCQIAGIVNYSGNTQRAVQLAGITNIAIKGSTPFQFAGILNMAKHVKGVQLALFNYAEESDGVSIGLINIVKKGGKHEFEVAFSEALNTAVSFKLGTNKFYTIFSGGVNYINKPAEYAGGLGFGSHINWKQGWANQIELMGYALTENGSFNHKGISMLTQLKFAVSKEVFSNFKIFAGPVINMTISDYVNPTTGEVGSSLSPWSIWKNDSETTRLNGWIGFNIGVRY